MYNHHNQATCHGGCHGGCPAPRYAPAPQYIPTPQCIPTPQRSEGEASLLTHLLKQQQEQQQQLQQRLLQQHHHQERPSREVVCRDQEKCRFKLTCRFWHPQRQINFWQRRGRRSNQSSRSGPVTHREIPSPSGTSTSTRRTPTPGTPGPL
jgi:hypothetical protein